jgi:lia operon protein LiaF
LEEDTPVYTYDFRHKKHGEGLLGGLLLVFLGIVFLLNNLGFVPSSVWNEVWKFWPVLFILLGLRLLAGRNFVSRIIIALVTLFAFAGVLAYILYYYGVFRNFGF